MSYKTKNKEKRGEKMAKNKKKKKRCCG